MPALALAALVGGKAVVETMLSLGASVYVEDRFGVSIKYRVYSPLVRKLEDWAMHYCGSKFLGQRQTCVTVVGCSYVFTEYAHALCGVPWRRINSGVACWGRSPSTS